MIVHIPFMNRFSHPMLSGSKTWTSRTKKYGEIGDTFNRFNATFTITNVVKMPLLRVLNHYREEGCTSKEDFIEVWKSIHPRKGFDITQLVWVHMFERIRKKDRKRTGMPYEPPIEDMSLR